jgi:transmembrane sensor
MKPKSPNTNSQILDEASEWFVEFRAGDVDAPTRERFDEWLRQSPEHIRAYMGIARIYVEVPPPQVSRDIDVPALIAYANSAGNVVPLPSRLAARQPTRLELEASSAQSPPAHSEGVFIRHRALAASLITGVVVVAGLLAWQRERYPEFTTDIGEHRSLALADGSTVDLNARSKVLVEFSASERRVELLEGQALFQVAKDKSRPFIVKSGDATVRAVGTQFDVDRKNTGTTVTVIEGRVVVYSEVRPETSVVPVSSGESSAHPRTPAVTKIQNSPAIAGAPPDLPPDLAPPTETGSAVYVGAGEQVTVSSQALAPPEHADVGAATAWMQRRLVFDGTTLSDVVEQFNRNNRRQLIIESASLEGYHVSGTYSSTDPASLVRFLREQPGFKITETDNAVRIAAK